MTQFTSLKGGYFCFMFCSRLSHFLWKRWFQNSAPPSCVSLALSDSPGCCVNSLHGAHHVTTACVYDQPSGPANESSVTWQHRNSRWQINIMCLSLQRRLNSCSLVFLISYRLCNVRDDI